VNKLKTFCKHTENFWSYSAARQHIVLRWTVKKYATGEENMPVFDKKFVVKTLVEKVKKLPDDLQAEFFSWLEKKISAKKTL
jgi:hypothetical protein